MLSREVRASFPHPDDFLDGDPFGQNYDHLADISLTYETMLAPLAGGKLGPETDTVMKGRKGNIKDFRRTPYVNSYAQRAPVVQLGTYKYTGKRFVQRRGDNLRIISLESFLTEFEAIEADLQRPCVFMAAFNKEWGYLSEPVAHRVTPPASVATKGLGALSPLTTGNLPSLFFTTHLYIAMYVLVVIH